jgi:3-isopropylmalate/(R)-2-methylmalate dehydratase small subunit
MEPFTTVTSRVIPLPLKDIDTDQIIPAQYLTGTGREGYGEGLFKRLRDQDPSFPLNQERYSDAQILCADSNFGCGSSREHAAWALLGWGIHVVIAPSFADIFTSNSLKNGLVLVTLPQATVTTILKAAQEADAQMTVDLQTQTVVLPDGTEMAFEFDPFRRECILKGYDDLDYIQSHQTEIAEYRKIHNSDLFYTADQPNRSLAPSS